MKFIFSILGALATFIIAMRNERRGRRALAAIDAGERCIRCDGGNTVVDGDTVRCSDCGLAASLARLRGAVLTDREIIVATRPEGDDVRGFDPWK